VLVQKGLKMGYTHYWYRDEKLDKEKFAKASKDCKLVTDYLRSKGIQIQFESDEPDPPVFSDELIRFNGQDEEGHETFYIAQEFDESYRQPDDDGKLFAFCKTAYKPYDTAVIACLIVLKHHLGESIRLSSDGDKNEWQAGLEAVQSVLNYGEIPNSIRQR